MTTRQCPKGTRKVPGLQRYALSRDILQVHGGEPLYLVAELDFDDTAVLREAFDTPEGKALIADTDVLTTNAEVRITVYELDDMLNGPEHA
ncbi:EthD family reductase [Spirillospora sp. NPDC050679]